MKIIAVAAIDLNCGIGENNNLLFKIPEDMKHFKELTTGHSVIMGRKTFESIGKALPNRYNIILTRNMQYSTGEDVLLFSDFDYALEAADAFGKDLFVIGGSEIYKEFLDRNLVDEIYLTVYNKKFDNANKFFPDDGNSYGFVKDKVILRGKYDGYDFAIVKLVKEE